MQGPGFRRPGRDFSHSHKKARAWQDHASKAYQDRIERRHRQQEAERRETEAPAEEAD